jgi:hypothetical protein
MGGKLREWRDDRKMNKMAIKSHRQKYYELKIAHG